MRLLLRAMVVCALGTAQGLIPSAKAETPSPATGLPAEANPPSPNSVKQTTSRTGEADVTAGARPGRGITTRTTKGSRAAHRKQPINPNLPLAQAPNFEMRADGTSVVSLLLSQPTAITRLVRKNVKGRARVAEFLLSQAQVGVHNNTNPLVTAHFQTPLTRVVLRRSKKGAILRLDFREDVEVTHLTKPGPGGSTLVEILVPKATKTHRAAVAKQPKTSSESGEMSSGTLRLNEEPTPAAPPGPQP